MATFLVTLAGSGTEDDGVDTMLVVASNSASALLVAASLHDSGDKWAGATAVDVSTLPPTDFTGWLFRVDVYGVAGAPPVFKRIEYTGATSDDIDAVGTGLAAAAVAAGIAGAAYNTSTNVLKVAETTDNLGKRKIACYAFPPGSKRHVKDWNVFSTIVHGAGSDATVLSVTLVAPSTIPAVLAKLGTP